MTARKPKARSARTRPRGLRVFAATFAAGMASVMALIYAADPAGKWHRALHYSPRRLVEPEVWVFPEANWDERKVRAEQLRQIDPPDVLLVGSSRAVFVEEKMLTQAGMLQPGGRFFNLGVSGGTLEDAIVFWQMAKNLGKVPREVLLVLDPWALNRNSGQLRWQTHAALFHQFLSEQSRGPAQGAEVAEGVEALAAGARESAAHARETLEGWRENALELVSWTALKGAWKVLSGGEKAPGSGWLATESTRPRDKTGYRWDGSNFYTDAAIQPKVPEEIRKIALAYALEGQVWNLWNWEFNAEALRQLGLLLRDIARQGAKTRILIPPYQPLAYEKVLTRPGFSGIFPQFVQAIASEAATAPATTFCNAIDPATSGCGETEFMDGMHMLRSCVEKVLARCGQASFR